MSMALSMGSIELLTLASGASTGVAKMVEIPGVTTALATSAFTDHIVDKHRARNCHAISVVCLILGSFVGAIASFTSVALPLLLSDSLLTGERCHHSQFRSDLTHHLCHLVTI